MSIYLDEKNPGQHKPFQDASQDVVDYVRYLEVIAGKSPNTAFNYYCDLRNFSKFMKKRRGLVPEDAEMKDIDPKGLDTAFWGSVTREDIYEYLYFLNQTCGNKKSSTARRLASLHGFYDYMVNHASRLENDPTAAVSPPKLDKVCGMRLAELVGMNLEDIDLPGRQIRLFGKGHKERMVYLNDACVQALDRYLQKRGTVEGLSPKERAVFITRMRKDRISNRRVEQIITAAMKAAGLQGYSTHKLRHTAATLMYQTGTVDVLTLKELLGHSNVSTTQIYTHLKDAQVRAAVEANPLGAARGGPPAPETEGEGEGAGEPLPDILPSLPGGEEG